MGGYERLAQADAAISGGDFRMEINFEGLCTQATEQQVEQQHILETTAAEANAVQFALLADVFGEFDEELC